MPPFTINAHYVEIHNCIDILFMLHTPWRDSNPDHLIFRWMRWPLSEIIFAAVSSLGYWYIFSVF
jgi:hypothetical protein